MRRIFHWIDWLFLRLLLAVAVALMVCVLIGIFMALLFPDNSFIENLHLLQGSNSDTSYIILSMCFILGGLFGPE